MERRRALGGSLPRRIVRIRRPISLPLDNAFEEFDAGSNEQSVSTTMGFTRLLRNLARDENIGQHIVPIVPDEARTFGMDSLFRELKIYASQGQKYEPVDHALLLSYAESTKGQILEEGITEAGAMSSFIAAGTAYATRGVPMVPFYIFYSMFGFQRVGDLIWQAADARTRGFLLGATAGRTTLQGEGLQHQDGHSLLLASTVPACQAYDPAFAYEVSAIIKSGLERMYGDTPEDIFYYIALYNENQPMPARPTGVTADQITSGLYQWAPSPTAHVHASLVFSGSANLAAREAASVLLNTYGISVDLWSATSYKALRQDAMSVERFNRLHPREERQVSLVAQLLGESDNPVIAVSDFMRIVPEQIANHVSRPFVSLGTDGVGRSDTRDTLRRYFEIDSAHIVVATLNALVGTNGVTSDIVAQAIATSGIDPDAAHGLVLD